MNISSCLHCWKCKGENTLAQWSPGKVSLTVYCRDCHVGQTNRVMKRDRKAVEDKIQERVTDGTPF